MGRVGQGRAGKEGKRNEGWLQQFTSNYSNCIEFHMATTFFRFCLLTPKIKVVTTYNPKLYNHS